MGIWGVSDDVISDKSVCELWLFDVVSLHYFCTPRVYNLNFLTAAIHLCVQKERNTKTD